jgi:hypothetical protein
MKNSDERVAWVASWSFRPDGGTNTPGYLQMQRMMAEVPEGRLITITFPARYWWAMLSTLRIQCVDIGVAEPLTSARIPPRKTNPCTRLATRQPT